MACGSKNAKEQLQEVQEVNARETCFFVIFLYHVFTGARSVFSLSNSNPASRQSFSLPSMI